MCSLNKLPNLNGSHKSTRPSNGIQIRPKAQIIIQNCSIRRELSPKRKAIESFSG